ncbi:MAG: hypothetical protein DWI21_05010, partial [Planctomycetota bacterium]
REAHFKFVGNFAARKTFGNAEQDFAFVIANGQRSCFGCSAKTSRRFLAKHSLTDSFEPGYVPGLSQGRPV